MTGTRPTEADAGAGGGGEPPADPADEGQRLRDRLSLPAGMARHVLMPVLLVIVLALLYLYVSSIELDRIEARLLTWPRIRAHLIRHIQLAGVATIGIIVIAVPLGIVLTRSWASRFTPVAVNVANAGQAIPSLGVLVLLFVWWRAEYGVSYFNIAVTALIIYGILPVLRNTLVGIQQIDPAEIEAGRGMGMRQREVLWHIELPLAVPVILAGIRVSLILAVGTAALAVFIGAGGLGTLIQTGISLQRTPVLLTGAVVTAVLALLADWLAGVVEDLLTPRGL